MELIGIIGSILFTFSNIPTVLKTIKYGKVSFIPILTQWSLFLGSLLILIYLISKGSTDYIIMSSYIITMISWLIVLKYNYFPRS